MLVCFGGCSERLRTALSGPSPAHRVVSTPITGAQSGVHSHQRAITGAQSGVHTHHRRTEWCPHPSPAHRVVSTAISGPSPAHRVVSTAITGAQSGVHSHQRAITGAQSGVHSHQRAITGAQSGVHTHHRRTEWCPQPSATYQRPGTAVVGAPPAVRGSNSPPTAHRQPTGGPPAQRLMPVRRCPSSINRPPEAGPEGQDTPYTASGLRM